MASWKYDTFLNYVHYDDSPSKRFVSFLCRRLQNIGIMAFNDDRDLRSKTEIMEAIEESRTAIIIFFLDYDHNERFLEELTKIMECVQSKGLIPIPLFYGVDRSSILWLVNTLTEVLFEGISVEAVQSWKESLRKACEFPELKLFPSFSSSSFYREEEDKCFREIVDKIWQAQGIPKYPVGIESRAQEIKSLLKLDLAGVYYVGVCGISGVGKRTVARAIFDEISCQFDGSCFLAKVRTSSETHGLGQLQQKLLSQLLKQHLVNESRDDEEVDVLSQILRLKKVLIVLNDVDDAHQLEYLVGKRDWFGDGSRIITTTRNADLLCKHDELYRVPQLANHEALELFRWDAFQQAAPVKEFEELSNCVVNYAKGLPLVLEGVGSFLHKRGMEQLRSDLHRLEGFVNGKIVQLLSLSLDALCNDDKNIFLHIACFFRGKKKDDVVTVLDRLGFRSELGIDVLIERSLLYMSKGLIQMHDFIAQMGRQVALDTEHYKHWKYNSSLWHEKSMKTVFSASQITRTPAFIASLNESTQKWDYDAFLSFRGEDTRNNFVAHFSNG